MICFLHSKSAALPFRHDTGSASKRPQNSNIVYVHEKIINANVAVAWGFWQVSALSLSSTAASLRNLLSVCLSLHCWSVYLSAIYLSVKTTVVSSDNNFQKFSSWLLKLNVSNSKLYSRTISWRNIYNPRLETVVWISFSLQYNVFYWSIRTLFKKLQHLKITIVWRIVYII